MSAPQLARVVGVRVSAVSKWELGQRNIPLATLCAICAAFRMSPARLLRQAEQVYYRNQEGLHAAD